MDIDLINKLVNRASQLGAKNIEVIGWCPPQLATSDPDGVLITKTHTYDAQSSADTPWYDVY